MTNLEPIVRKLISSNMLCCNPQDALSTYFLYYGDKHLSRAKNQDESEDQVIDWFYYRVLQLNMENEEA